LKLISMIVVTAFSYFFGLAAYVTVLYSAWGQTISTGDAKAILFWSALAYIIVCIPIYLLSFTLVDRIFRKPLGIYYPIFSMFSFVLPTGFIMFLFGDLSLRAIISPEAQLFYAMFGVSGFVYGMGWFLIKRDRSR
jgi:hypothetical protein